MSVVQNILGIFNAVDFFLISIPLGNIRNFHRILLQTGNVRAIRRTKIVQAKGKKTTIDAKKFCPS